MSMIFRCCLRQRCAGRSIIRQNWKTKSRPGLFKAVAEVLAYVFQLKRHKQRQGPAPRQLDKNMDIPEEYRKDE